MLLGLFGIGIVGSVTGANSVTPCAEAYDFRDVRAYSRWAVGLDGLVPVACTTAVSVDGEPPTDETGRLVVFRSCRREIGGTASGGHTMANILEHPDIGIDTEESTNPVAVRVDNRQIRTLEAKLIEMT